MDIIRHTSNNEECVVTGALSLTLRLSSFVGLAPLRFVPLQNGYRVSVSHYRALYGYILITLLNTIGCITILADTKRKITEITWEYIFFSLAVIVLIILCSLGSYYAVGRMKNMIIYLNCLGKIKTNMKMKIIHKAIENKIKSVIIMIHLCIIIALPLVQLVTNFKNTIKDPINISYMVFYIHITLVYLLQAQLVLMFLEIQSSLRVINNTIDEMLCLDEFAYPPSPTFSSNVRCFTHAFVSACDVVPKLNKEYGIAVTLVMCYLITRILNIGCSLSTWSSVPSLYVLAFRIFWCILNCLDFLAFIEGFNFINNEVTNLKVKLCKLMYKATDIGCRISIELKLIHNQLNLNNMTFSPFSIFTLERTLTIRILSGIFTYFLFILQVK